MIHSAEVEKKVFPIINQCLDGIVNAAQQINEKKVIYLLNYIFLFSQLP